MGSRRELTIAAVAVLCSAVLFGFGNGYHPVPGLVFLAPLPVLLAAPRVRRALAFGAGFAGYLIGSTGTWGYYFDSIDIPLPAALSIIIGCSALLGLGALLLAALVARRRVLLAAVAPGAVWCAVLYLVSFASPVGLQYQLAISASDLPVVTQTAALAGGFGVEFLVLFVPSAIAAVTAPGVRRLPAAAVAGVLVVAALGFGTVRLATNDPADPGRERRVATVADNVPHWALDVTGPDGRALIKSYVDRIGTLSDMDMVVLPEGNFDADETSLPDLVEPLADAARRGGADIVAGVILHTGGERYNISLAIPANGGKPVAYRKWHVEAGSPLTAGHDLAFAGPGTGLLNCLDVNFADPSRDYASAGTRFVAIPAADGDLNGWQHSRQGLLRGVEYGFSVAWSAQLGTSLLADGLGRPLAQAATTGGPGLTVAVASVPDGPGATPYGRLGDWFAWLCVLVTLGACVLARGRVVKPTPPDESMLVTTR
jgi:apolipoprotein N-acyltransferase